jgi:hypothetical protein
MLEMTLQTRFPVLLVQPCKKERHPPGIQSVFLTMALATRYPAPAQMRPPKIAEK